MRNDFGTAREALVEFAKMIDVAIARTMVAAGAIEYAREIGPRLV